MSRIVINEAREDRIYAAIHGIIIKKRVEILRSKLNGGTVSAVGVTDTLANLVGPIFDAVREELRSNLEAS